MVKKYWFFIVMIVGLFIIFFVLPQSDGDTAEFIAISDIEDEASQDVSSIENSSVIVDIKGEVHTPGVYEVDPDSRINDVIKLAGGFTVEADQLYVNLAQKVQDEMTIIVPKQGADDRTGQSDSTKVRINYATESEIKTLNGIGPSKAQAIIQYREENGFFKTIEDLLNVSGIGESTLDNIRNDIQIP